MGKKNSPCGRTDKAVEVEDHGNGFMFIGCSDIDQAKGLIVDYVDNPEDYVYAGRPYYRRKCCVWLAVEPFAMWEGARYPTGELIDR